MLETFVKPLFTDIKTFVLDTLFPIKCLVCQKEAKNFLCETCEPGLVRVKQICICCKQPSLSGITHPSCKTPFAPEGLISLFDYHDDGVARLIITGKYYFIPAIYNHLGSLLGKYLKTNYQILTTNYQLVPLPLFWMRQNWRGFNQADKLCQAISLELNLPVSHILKRWRTTRTQKDLKKDDRLNNIIGAFRLKDGTEAKEQNFILVDDVATTGTTLLEAVKVLKRNGAKQVWCLTVAKD